MKVMTGSVLVTLPFSMSGRSVGWSSKPVFVISQLGEMLVVGDLQSGSTGAVDAVSLVAGLELGVGAKR